jgi:integrase/recombinase XerD
MARRGHRKPQQVTGDRSRSAGMTMRAEEFLEWLRVRQYSERTIHTRRECLSYFITWCEERGLVQPEEITRSILERYQHWLAHKRKANGQPLEARTQYMRIVPVKMLFRWLCRQNYILYNPASELEMPRFNYRLPRAVLSAREAEIVLGQPDITHPLGLRDRAILETFYSTGMRRLELLALTTFDVDRERGTVIIRQGKGKKDRIIPIGERALFWIDRYLSEVRPSLLRNPNEQALFLTHWGEPIMPANLSSFMCRYIEAAQIGKKGACHIFRHTMATLMLENGADIRFIQAMLGHADLSSTEVYTHVAVQKLKAVHDQTHPAALLKDLAQPAQKTPPDPQERAALLASLKATGAHVKNS